MFISLVEGANIIFAGHYSGLCYHTDGKSHQSINDMSVFSSLHPKLFCVDPPTPFLAELMLEKVIENNVAAYFRLRRTPVPRLHTYIDTTFEKLYGLQNQSRENLLKSISWNKLFSPILLSPSMEENSGVLANDAGDNTATEIAFVSSGTVGTELSIDCITKGKSFYGCKLALVTLIRGHIERDQQVLKFWKKFFFEVHKHLKYVIVIEDDVGALYNYVCKVYSSLSCNGNCNINILSKNISKAGPSQRTLESCKSQFGFTIEEVEKQLSLAKTSVS